MGIANTARASVIRLMPIVESARFPINQSARPQLAARKLVDPNELQAIEAVRQPEAGRCS